MDIEVKIRGKWFDLEDYDKDGLFRELYSKFGATDSTWVITDVKNVPYFLAENGIEDDWLWDYVDIESRIEWYLEEPFCDYCEYTRTVDEQNFRDSYIGDNISDEDWGHMQMDDSPAFYDSEYEELLGEYFDYEKYGETHREGTFTTDGGYMFWDN